MPWGRAAREESWSALYTEQLPRIYNFLRYRVGPEEAEDLTSRVFEKAWIHRHRYRRDLAAFGTWLYAIARNEATDFLRRRRPHVPLEAASEVTGGDTPEDEAVRRSDRERLLRLLAALGERERDLVALKFGAELTNREIARLTGLGESNVGTILHRTIRALRRDWNLGEAK